MSRPVVAIIGRPNVGKSSLFNRIIGTDSAIVDDEAGTTRDRHFAAAEWGGRQFWLVDTGGLRDDPAVPMDREIRRQVEVAIDEADLMMLVLDATAGLHPSDGKIVAMLRVSGKIVAIIGPVGVNAMTKIMGFLIMCIGVQFVVNGVLGIATDPELLRSIKEVLAAH